MDEERASFDWTNWEELRMGEVLDTVWDVFVPADQAAGMLAGVLKEFCICSTELTKTLGGWYIEVLNIVH